MDFPKDVRAADWAAFQTGNKIKLYASKHYIASLKENQLFSVSMTDVPSEII